MASTIKLKTSTSDGNVPASLSKGEVAINVADGVWYYGGESGVQQNFKFGGITVTGDTSLDGKLVVTGNTVLNGTLSATTSLKVGNGNGTISAATITGVVLKGTIGSDAAPVTAYINGGEIDGIAIGSETPAISIKSQILTLEPDSGGQTALLIKAPGEAEGNWVTITNAGDDVMFKINNVGVTTITSAILSTADINAGTIDNTEIGNSTRNTGKFTTMDVNSTLVVTGNSVFNGRMSGCSSLDIGNGAGQISAATMISSGDITSGGDVYTDVVRRQSDSSTTTKIKLDDESIKCFGSSSSVWSTKVSSQQLEVGQAGAGLISASTATISGYLGVSGNTYFPDNGKAIFGAGDDLKIYHSGSHSIIQDSGTGDLHLKGSIVKVRGTSVSEDLATFTENGNVELYYDNAKKFETTSNGISASTNVTVGNGDGLISAATLDSVTQKVGNGTAFSPRPNLYWFGNCDAATIGPASDGSFPATNTTDVSWGETYNSHAAVFSAASDQVQIIRAGLYKISYNVTLETGADSTTTNRTGGAIALLRKAAGGTYAVVAGTESYTYNRIAGIETNTGTISVIYNVTANDVFKIVFLRTAAQTSSSKLATIPAGTAWTIEAVT